MKVRFSKQALKFLENLDDKKHEAVRLKLKQLSIAVAERGIIPYKELQNSISRISLVIGRAL